MAQTVFGAAYVVAAVNRAFSNTSLGNAVFNNNVTVAGTTQATQYAYAASVGQNYSGVSDATLAATVLANLGVTATTDLTTALTGAFASAGVANRGIVVLQLATLLSTLETATGTLAVYNTAATNWNKTVEQAFVYSSNTANTSASTGVISTTAGQTYTLTTGVDTPANTAGDDTYNATLVNNEAAAAGTGTTLQVSDVIDGGAGTDVLSLLVVGANSSGAALAQTLGSTSNVETLTIKNLSTGSNAGATINASTATAVTSVINNGSTADVAVTGVQTNAAVTVNSTKANTSVTFADGKVTGGVTLNVNGAGTTATNATITLATASAAGTATTATINATGANYVTLAGGASAGTSVGAANGIKTLTITGSGSVALTAASTLINGTTLAADLTKLDASTNTGGVTATISSTSTSGVTVTGGSGVDVITIGGALAAGATINLGAGNDKLLNNSGSIAASTASKTTVIDGGDGVDILAASLVTAGNGSVFKNFEVLSLGGASVDAALLTGSTLTALSVDAALGGNYTYSNVTQAMALTNNAGGVDNSARTTTLTFTGVTGTTDSYSITFNGNAQTTVPTAANTQLGTVAAAGIENFTIVSGGAANTWNSLTLGADTSARTVTITGDKNLDLAFAASFGEVNGTNGTVGVSLIDGSAATGKLSINLANVVNATAGLAVKTGSAADTITTSTSKVTVTGGAGADNFVVGATVYGTGKNFVTITDATAGDKITLVDMGTETFTTAKVNVSAAQTLAGALGIALSSTDGSTNGAIKWFQYGSDTYIVEALTNNGTITDAATTDLVVKLTGLIDLSTASGAGTNVLTLA